MHKVILTRLVQLPLVLAIIYLLTFVLVWVVPGDPFTTEKNMDEAVKRVLRERYHADSAWSFLRWYPYNAIVHRDLGWSMQYREWSVNDIIWRALPVSITLGLFALTIALLMGVGVGTLAAVKRDGPLDWASLSISLVGISLPSFVTAAILLVAAASSRAMPVGGWGHFSDIVLPGIALSLLPMAYIARLTRVAMLDVLGSDYVRTARAKGLSNSVVIWKHCLRNALLPVLSYLGPAAAVALTGSFVVEKVFNIPGLGQYFVNSVLNRDRTLVLGVVMVYSAMQLVFNLLVDIAYAWVDPRIDISGAGEGK
jgi:oligopeptide transport system permease protein